MRQVEKWIEGTLGDICNIRIGGTPSRNNELFWDTEKATENLWVSIKDLNRQVIEDTNEYITDLGIKRSNVKKINQGEILLSFKLTIGKVAYAGKSLYTNEAIAALNSETMEMKFLYYGLQQWDLLQNVDQAIKGATLNKDKLNKIKFKYPESRDMQQKIAEVLGTIDKCIFNSERLIAKQERIKTGLMQDLLAKGIDEKGNVRSENTHQFKDSPLGRIPLEWDPTKMDDLLIRINQGWSPDCDTRSASEGEWGVLKTSAIDWLKYDDTENKKLPENLAIRYDLEIKNGDLLMTRAGPNSRVGVVAYVYKTREKLILSDKIYRLCTSSEIDRRFLCYALSGYESQKKLSNFKTGMAESQTNISQEIVRNLLTVVPKINEQIAIANILDIACEEIDSTKNQLRKLELLKIGVMQALLTGKKSVSHLLDDWGDGYES